MIWEDPPRPRTGVPGNKHASRRGNSPYYETVADSLRRYPWRWAKIATFNDRRSANTERTRLVSGGELSLDPLYLFEITQRDTRLYARYIGSAPLDGWPWTRK